MLDRIPLVALIAHTLAEKENRSMRSDFFLSVLEEYFPEAEALRQFDIAVEWGRYAELFSFDATEERLISD